MHLQEMPQGVLPSILRRHTVAVLAAERAPLSESIAAADGQLDQSET